jgi:hypothetical protein
MNSDRSSTSWSRTIRKGDVVQGDGAACSNINRANRPTSHRACVGTGIAVHEIKILHQHIAISGGQEKSEVGLNSGLSPVASKREATALGKPRFDSGCIICGGQGMGTNAHEIHHLWLISVQQSPKQNSKAVSWVSKHPISSSTWLNVQLLHST